MARTDDPYSRVYWRAADDPKFVGLWSDDRALATWLRLLLQADQAWPGSAPLYFGIHKPSLDKLVKAKIVTVTDGRFRVVGLDAERERRASAGRAGADARWGRDEPPPEPPGDDEGSAGGDAPAPPKPSGRSPNADAPRMRPQSGSDASQAEPSQGEPRRGEPSRAHAADALLDDGDDHLDAWFRLTASAPTAKSLPWLNRLAEEYGSPAVCDAMAEAWREDSDRSTLLTRTQNVLWSRKHEAEKAAELRSREEAKRERSRIAEMPPEQRAANLARLRDQLVSSGLMSPAQAATYTRGETA